MAWFGGKVNLGNFPDLAGAVNKFSESVKNIEKNFDTALGFEEKSDTGGEGLWPTATNRKTLFDPVMAFMANKAEEGCSEASQLPGDAILPSPTEGRNGTAVDSSHALVEQKGSSAGETEVPNKEKKEHLESTDYRSPSIAEIMALRGGENEASNIENELPHVDTVDEENEFPKIGNEPTHANTADGENEFPKIENEPTHFNAADEEIEVHKFESALTQVSTEDDKIAGTTGTVNAEFDLQLLPAEQNESTVENIEKTSSPKLFQQEILKTSDNVQLMETKPGPAVVDHGDASVLLPDESQNDTDSHERVDEQKIGVDGLVEDATQSEAGLSSNTQYAPKSSALDSFNKGENGSAGKFSESHFPQTAESDVIPEVVSGSCSHEKDAVAEEDVVIQQTTDNKADNKEQLLSSAMIAPDSDSVVELERVKMEMKMMETALQGAARQAQAKADEIARMMNENEQLKSVIEDLKRKSNEADVEALRGEYHQRVAALERKVYALTKERDTLRREQNKKSDAAVLLKEKDEIINQVMAEGEELSKKQAAQESQMRKLRAQIREFEEEKKGLVAKLQVEENKVESIKRDKAATEKLLQETIEQHQAELSAQKEYFTNSLAVAKEAEALAEARANNEARTELESRLREADEREAMLVQELEELRQTLSRKEQQAVFREDMLRKDIEDLQKRYQASERRCEELITQVPESTRPLLRQIEAIQETASRRADAWSAVERSLNSRLQEAESKAAAAVERERSINERLSQTLSRTNVLEAQISCLRAEQGQLSRSLEKERQRAAENRQEYLATKEEAETHEGHARQLEVELRGLKKKHKEELQDVLANRELLQQEVERERNARLDLERTAHIQSSALSDQTPTTKPVSPYDNGNLARRISSASSMGSMEESYFLQASLDSSDNLSERRYVGEMNITPYYMKHMTPSSFEATLRQKEGELASYMSRLASVEAIRDSLAEELVKMTGQCEKLQAESAMLPGLRTELEALRRRHSAALELMGERDEELEELRADIVDLKDMYREQVNILVNKIQILSSTMSGAV